MMSAPRPSPAPSALRPVSCESELVHYEITDFSGDAPVLAPVGNEPMIKLPLLPMRSRNRALKIPDAYLVIFVGCRSGDVE